MLTLNKDQQWFVTIYYQRPVLAMLLYYVKDKIVAGTHLNFVSDDIKVRRFSDGT